MVPSQTHPRLLMLPSKCWFPSMTIATLSSWAGERRSNKINNKTFKICLENIFVLEKSTIINIKLILRIKINELCSVPLALETTKGQYWLKTIQSTQHQPGRATSIHVPLHHLSRYLTSKQSQNILVRPQTCQQQQVTSSFHDLPSCPGNPSLLTASTCQSTASWGPSSLYLYSQTKYLQQHQQIFATSGQSHVIGHLHPEEAAG